MPDFAQLLPEEFDPATFDEPVRVVGIDLGTTNSTVADITYDPRAGGMPVVRCLEVDQPTAEGTYTHVLVPSVVAVLGDKVVVGEGAKRLRARASELKLEQNKDLFWECKNDVGLRRTYHRAPTGFRSAKEIAGHVLSFLAQAARSEDERPIDRVVVTVPASFQTAQRQDTLEAGRLAGLELVGGDLLDEPVAAFIDRLVSEGHEGLVRPGEAKNLLVFDFGGGTCDVAVLRLSGSACGGPPRVAPLAVSRYHRLGGGDVDAAIVYDVLLPQILQQNSVSHHDLTFTDKKRWIEPSFLGVAEALKIGLSSEIDRLSRFGKYPPADKKQVFKMLPGQYECRLPDGRVLHLQSPTLDAQQFETLLEPFLDRDLLYAQETEYRTTCSILSPLDDALSRAGVPRGEVDLCLLVGGSTLLVPVRQALADYFPNAQQLLPGGPDEVQTAVARGAGLHALALALTGRGLVQPAAADRICLRSMSEDGAIRLVELVPRSAPLPYPPDSRWREIKGLTVPRSSRSEPVDIRIELVDSDDALLLRVVWPLSAPVRRGDPLLLRLRLDENQLLELNMTLAAKPEMEPFICAFENPLTNVVNPQKQRQRIDELEEALRTGAVPRDKIPNRLVQLADLYQELGQREKAVDILRRALQARGQADPLILNRMGILCEAMRDSARAERLYREAAEHDDWGGALFNLALHYKRCGKLNDALAAVDEAIEREKDPPYLVLKAQLVASLQKLELKDECLDEAFRLFGPPDSLSDWSLGWFETAAQLAGDSELASRAREERRKRAGGAEKAHEVTGDLPKLSGDREGVQ